MLRNKKPGPKEATLDVVCTFAGTALPMFHTYAKR